MDIVKLLNYMENLRYDRKMTQDAYLAGIISQRQYYRYRSGESEVPFDVILKFANKLQIPLLKLISSFQQHSEKEKEVVSEYYNLVIRKRLKEAREFMKEHRNLMLLDESTQVFYYLSRVLYDFFSGRLSNSEMIVQLKKKIDFQNIMKKEVLHDSELYLLGVIMEYSEEDRKDIFNKIVSLRKNNKLLLGGNVLFNSQVYFWIVKNLGRMNQYDELITIADIALEYCKKNYFYYSTEYFHYYKSLAFLRKGLDKEFENELLNTIYVLLQLDEHKRKRFFQVIKKDTNISCKEFLIAKLEKELE